MLRCVRPTFLFVPFRDASFFIPYPGFPSVTRGFHEKAKSNCRSDVADRRLESIRQGMNQASIRTLISRGGWVSR